MLTKLLLVLAMLSCVAEAGRSMIYIATGGYYCHLRYRDIDDWYDHFKRIEDFYKMFPNAKRPLFELTIKNDLYTEYTYKSIAGWELYNKKLFNDGRLVVTLFTEGVVDATYNGYYKQGSFTGEYTQRGRGVCLYKNGILSM